MGSAPESDCKGQEEEDRTTDNGLQNALQVDVINPHEGRMTRQSTRHIEQTERCLVFISEFQDKVQRIFVWKTTFYFIKQLLALPNHTRHFTNESVATLNHLYRPRDWLWALNSSPSSL
jgi:hypothetical protein